LSQRYELHYAKPLDSVSIAAGPLPGIETVNSTIDSTTAECIATEETSARDIVETTIVTVTIARKALSRKTDLRSSRRSHLLSQVRKETRSDICISWRVILEAKATI
jgi:hypothetical protein